MAYVWINDDNIELPKMAEFGSRKEAARWIVNLIESQDKKCQWQIYQVNIFHDMIYDGYGITEELDEIAAWYKQTNTIETYFKPVKN
jgi:hypothetical protein